MRDAALLIEDDESWLRVLALGCCLLEEEGAAEEALELFLREAADVGNGTPSVVREGVKCWQIEIKIITYFFEVLKMK